MSITIDKSIVIGATTVRMRLTEHGSAHITDQCGPQQREIYVPIDLLHVFMAAHAAATERAVDVTAQVQFRTPDDESLPLTQCVCGASFVPWVEGVISVYRDPAWQCTHCQRRLYFCNGVRVYEVVP